MGRLKLIKGCKCRIKEEEEEAEEEVGLRTDTLLRCSDMSSRTCFEKQR
jgi:hypothetical protein